MAHKISVDTSVIFDFFQGKEYTLPLKESIAMRRLYLPVIVVYELLAGVTNASHIEQRKMFIDLCTILPLNSAVAQLAAGLYTDLRNRGKTVSSEDLLIAAACIAYELPLLSVNYKDFSEIKGLQLISPESL